MPGAPLDLDAEARRRGRESTGTGALSGAATGGALGTAVLPGIGTAVGAGIGAIAGGIGGALSGRRSATQRLQDELLQKEIGAADRGELGLTQSEKDRLIQDETLAAGSRIQAQQADIARQNMASGGGFSGHVAQLQRDLAGQEAQNAASASRYAEDTSRAQEDRRYQQLTADLNQKAFDDAQGQMAARARTQGAIDSAVATTAELLQSSAGDSLRNALGIVDGATADDALLRATAEELEREYGGDTGAFISTAPPLGTHLA